MSDPTTADDMARPYASSVPTADSTLIVWRDYHVLVTRDNADEARAFGAMLIGAAEHHDPTGLEVSRPEPVTTTDPETTDA